MSCVNFGRARAHLSHTQSLRQDSWVCKEDSMVVTCPHIITPLAHPSARLPGSPSPRARSTRASVFHLDTVTQEMTDFKIL